MSGSLTDAWLKPLTPNRLLPVVTVRSVEVCELAPLALSLTPPPWRRGLDLRVILSTGSMRESMVIAQLDELWVEWKCFTAERSSLTRIFSRRRGSTTT